MQDFQSIFEVNDGCPWTGNYRVNLLRVNIPIIKMKYNQELDRRQGCLGADCFGKKYYASVYKSVYSRSKIYYVNKI